MEGFRRVHLAFGLLLAGTLSVSPVRAQAQGEVEAYNKAWTPFSQLLKDGQHVELIEQAEAWLRRFPDDSWHQRRIVGLIGSVFSMSYPETKDNRALAERILANFADVPNYYTLAAERLAHSYLTCPERELLDPAKAEEVVKGALEQLGDQLSPQLIYARQLLVWRVHALYGQGKFDEALAAAKQAAERAPLVLEDRYLLRWVYFCVKQAHPEQLLSAAKLYFVLCDYDQKWVNEGIDLVSQSLAAAEGPGVALQFAKAQTEPGPNPLAAIPLYPLADAAALRAAAGDDPQAQFDVLLYEGKLAEAVALAKAQMRASAGSPAGLAIALKNLARCFKAHDGAVARANAFLHFHGTGEGDNPLPALEAELAAGGTAGG